MPAAFGLGGAEYWILGMICVVVLGPALIIAVVVWAINRGKASRPAQGVSAGWMADPTGRHELRYWNGSAWTAHVSDAGAPSQDPV